MTLEDRAKAFAVAQYTADSQNYPDMPLHAIYDAFQSDNPAVSGISIWEPLEDYDNGTMQHMMAGLKSQVLSEFKDITESSNHLLRCALADLEGYLEGGDNAASAQQTVNDLKAFLEKANDQDTP